MVSYAITGIFSQLIIALVWFAIVVVGKNNVDVRTIGVYLALVSGIPLLIHCLTNIVICRRLKDQPFIAVFLVSVCSYFGELAIYLKIMQGSGGTYIDKATVMFLAFSFIPMISNLLLFWFFGIRYNDFFDGCKIQRVRTRQGNGTLQSNTN